MSKKDKGSESTKTYLDRKERGINPERHTPLKATTPENLRSDIEANDVTSLEETLLEVETARLEAMLRLGDNSGAKRFIKPSGAALIATCFSVIFYPSDNEEHLISRIPESATFILLALGIVLFAWGHMWLADTKGEMEVKARDYDHARVLRAIEELEQNESTDDHNATVHKVTFSLARPRKSQPQT